MVPFKRHGLKMYYVKSKENTMETIIFIIIIVIAIISIFVGLLPYILPVLVLFGLIGYISQRRTVKKYEQQETTPDVIDAEYTEREDTDQ